MLELIIIIIKYIERNKTGKEENREPGAQILCSVRHVGEGVKALCSDHVIPSKRPMSHTAKLYVILIIIMDVIYIYILSGLAGEVKV